MAWKLLSFYAVKPVSFRRAVVKITDYSQIQHLLQIRPASGTGSDSADFAQALAQASGQVGAETATSAASSTTLANTAGAADVGRILSLNMALAAGRVEETLGLLESYAEALADPSRTLKDIAPMADGLEAQSEQLTSLSAGLPDGSSLKDVTDQTAILAAVEAAKFKRGDYV